MSERRPTSRRRWIARIAIFLAANAVLTIVLAVVAFIAGWGVMAMRLPDPRGWQTDGPASQFTAADAVPGYTLDDYIAQEDRIFDELEALIAGPWAADRPGVMSRFSATSICNPATVLPRNWNRTFVLDADQPIAGALLIHGLSDSPYSLRRIGQTLHAHGMTVVGLRVPGHGTCPAALAEARWRDWTVAVRIAAVGLRDRLPAGTPIILCGFSNGGALAMHYTCASLDDPDLPVPAAITLYSPMIGITSLAEITRLYHLVAWVPAFSKARWSHLDTEIDPFKYSSWPTNASEQAWSLTMRLESDLRRLQKAGRLDELPPVLTFQSVVDSTVRLPLLIQRLYDRIPDNGSELVLFDVNRSGPLDDLLKAQPHKFARSMLERTDLDYRYTLVTNVGPDRDEVVVKTRLGARLEEMPLELSWPPSVFSLSHGAVPIPMDDPIYGDREATSTATGLNLGSIRLRGETGVLTISESLLIRLRYNPFFPVVEDRVLGWLAEHGIPLRTSVEGR